MLEEKSNKQNQLIFNLNDVIKVKDAVIVEKDNIITLKEEQITLLKRQKSSKMWQGLLFGFVGGLGTFTLVFAL